MNKYLTYLLLAIALQVSAATPTPTPVKPNGLKLTQGTVSRVLPVNPPCLKCSYNEVNQSGQRKFSGGSLGGNWTQFPAAGGPISIEWVAPAATCPPIPADASQVVQCSVSNPGSTGTWTQTHGWTQAPPPQCTLTALPWVPTSAPAGACHTAGIPPIANFHFVVTGNSVAFFGATNSDDQDGWITGWDWNFGDGSAHSSEQNPTHVYAVSGVYTVTEVVTDNDSLTGTGSQPVTIGSVTPVCPPMPPTATQQVQCNPGTGTWTQTHGWVASVPQVPPNACWTALPWTPATQPADCNTPPPPPGNFNIDLSYVDKQGAAYTAFKAYVDRAVAGNEDYGYSATDAAYMFKLDGGAQYATKAIADVEADVTAAEAAIAAGQNPDVADDSYLYIGDHIGNLAIVYAWANSRLTASQKTRWAAYANQAIHNVRYCTTTGAFWGGRSAPWSCWAVNDPYNNYYYSFTKAEMWWALAANDADLLNYLRTDRLTLLSSAYATIPGGGSLEGTGYGTSHGRLFELYQVWRDSAQGDLRNAHMTNSIEFWVHGTTPTMDRFVPIGDQSRVSEPFWYDYQRTLVLEAAHQTDQPSARADAGYVLANLKDSDGNPYLVMRNSFNDRYGLIPYSNSPAPVALTFRAPEVGLTTARTAWNLDATWLAIVMGKFDQSHAHQEQGGFTMFGKRTWLAVPNNIWSHSGLQSDTKDKNIVRFERSGVVIPQVAHPDSIVNVTSYTPNVTSGDTHIVGDVSPVYDDAGVHWTRTFDFVSGVATISDAMQLASGVTAIFQLQVPVQPTVSGNVITAGHLKATVIAPASPQISVVAMPSIDSDYNTGWRVDIKGSNSAYKVELRAN